MSAVSAVRRAAAVATADGRALRMRAGTVAVWATRDGVTLGRQREGRAVAVVPRAEVPA